MTDSKAEGFSDRLLIYSLAACVSLAVIGFEFFAGITAPRLALIFALVAGSIALSGRYVSIKAEIVLLSYFGLGSTFFFLAVISFIVVGGNEWAVISWLLMAILGFFVCLGFIATSPRSQDKIFNIIFFFGLLFFFSIFLYLALLGILWKPGYLFRLFSDEFATVGLNRVVNAMIFFSGVALVVALDEKASLLYKRAPAALMLTFMLYFCFAAGVRQGIIGTVLLVLTYTFAVFFRDGLTAGFRHISLRIIPAICFIAVIGIFFTESTGSESTDWLMSRFIGSIESQGSSGDVERLDALSAALSFAFYNNGFGVGLGSFKILHGIEPHNGYLGLFAEMGVYFFIFNMLGLFVFLIKYYIALKRKMGALSLFLMAYLPVHFLFVLNVKDILREPFTWALLGTVGLIGSGFSKAR